MMDKIFLMPILPILFYFGKDVSHVSLYKVYCIVECTNGGYGK